jgi:AcrR family transcriptional regulator
MADNTATPTRQNTRARILAACRDLFNERGPADVTTAQIAAAVGINEGNLYYHFNRKEQILEALFGEFEQELRDVAAAGVAYSGDPERQGDYLSGWFKLMWEWRFFYRDGGLIYRLAPSLRSRLQALSDYGQEQVRRVLHGQKRAGLIDASPEEIEQLIVNAWIVSTYWIDYLRSRHGVAQITRDHVNWGAFQVMSLFRPYLTAKGVAILMSKTDRPARPA